MSVDQMLQARSAQLRGRDNHQKDRELANLGIKPHEHPTTEPCRICGYDRRYAAPALQAYCLYCEANNQETL